MLEPASARSEGAAVLETLPDGSLRASGANPDGDTYTVVARTGLAEIRAIRLEALPDPSLPAEGTGRGAAGRFVLSRFGAEVASDVEEKAPVGRFVRVELPGKAKILSLAEVEVFSEGANVALGARPSSRAPTTPAPPRGRSTARPMAATRSPTRPRTPGPRTTRGGKSDWSSRPRSNGSASGTAPTRGSRTGCPGSACRCSTTTARSSGRPRWPSRPSRSASCRPPVRAPWPLPGCGPTLPSRAFDIAGIIDPKAAAAKSGWGVSPRQKERHEAVFVLSQPLAVPSPARSDLPPRASLESAGRQPRPVPARGQQRPRRGPLGRRAARGAGGPRHARGRTHGRAACRARSPLSLDRARAEAAPRRDRRAGAIAAGDPEPAGHGRAARRQAARDPPDAQGELPRPWPHGRARRAGRVPPAAGRGTARPPGAGAGSSIPAIR